MSLEYIRKTYGVPAKRGGRIRYDGKIGVIASAPGAYLRVSFGGKIRTLHPTWCVEYLEATSDERREARHQARLARLARRDNPHLCPTCGQRRPSNG